MAAARIGIIGTDNTHAYTYAAFMNGWAEDEPIPVRLPDGTPVPDMHLWAMLLRRSENDPAAEVPISGAQVTSVWSADRADAERLARACGIPTVCDSPEQVCDDVDAVMVLSERPESHLPYARFALQRGLRTYVDKPLAESQEAGQEIFNVAQRHGAPCYTGSGVRWSPELLAARAHIRNRLGRIKAVHVQCPLGLELYGIHAIEMVNLFVGNNVASIQGIAAADRQVVLLEYPNGTSAVFEHLNFLRWPTYSATLYGESWSHRVSFDDPAPTALAFVASFAEFARGGPLPVAARESMRLIEILVAAEESIRTGRRIEISTDSHHL